VAETQYTLFLSAGPGGAVTVRLPSGFGEGDAVDFSRVVRPGGDFEGIPYAELKAMGPGRHEVPASRFGPRGGGRKGA
jgi:hypothetical protein